MGKTTFAVSIILGMARANARVTCAFPATSPFEVWLRLGGALAGVDRGFGSIGWLSRSEDEKLQQGIRDARNLPIRLLEGPLLGFDELHAALRPAGRCEALVIHGLEAMSSHPDRERGPCLRWLARWLRVPVVVTVEIPLPDRPSHAPVLWDFPRDLVRAADVVMALDREAYFKGVDPSLSPRAREAMERETWGLVLWDREGLFRGFPMELRHREGPVFV